MAHFVGKCLNISPCPYTQTALTSGYWLHIACKIEWGINMITGDVNGVSVSMVTVHVISSDEICP